MTVLIHIGYPKAASTLLQQYFSEHPNVFYTGNYLGNYKMSGEAEIHQANLTKEQTHLVISEEQLSVWQGNLDIVGVKFKEYDIAAQQKKTAQQLQRQLPGAKILIVTRGFESALVSMYSQYVSIGGILTFAEFETQFGKIFAQFYNYNYLIETYRSIFGSGNVLVLPFEMLRQNSGRFIELINAHAGLPDFNFDAAIKNASLEKEEIESYRRLSNFIYRTMRFMPYSVQQRLYGLYVYMLYARKLKAFAGIFASEMDPPVIAESTIARFKGKADVLRGESLFLPYSKEYLF